MTVFANNVAQTLKEHSTLVNFLDYNNIKKFEGIAVAVNNEIIPKHSWDSHLLQENDKITIITATQGG